MSYVCINCGIVIDMKKIKFLFLPLLSISCLASCSGIDKEHSVLPFLNYDSKVIGADKTVDYVDYCYEITPFRFHEMLDRGMTFPIYLYGEYCSHCDDFKPILGKYIKNTNRQFYKCTFRSEEEYNFVNNDYPDVLANYIGTPAMLLIENGSLTYQLANNKFKSYEAFATIINKHFYSGNMYTVNTLDGLKYYMNDFQTKFIYCYDDASNLSIELFKKIYDKMLNNKTDNVLILNKNEISEENYAEICDYLGFNIVDIFAYYSKGNEYQTKTTDYTADGGSGMENFIANYFH